MIFIRKGIVLLLILAIVVVSLFIYNMTDRRDEESALENQSENNAEQDDLPNEFDPEDYRAPDFTLFDLDGEEVSLSDYRGKTILLNFWATWCKWCDAEMPDIQRLQEEKDDLIVLAVNVMESRKKAQEYMEEGGYDFQVLLDEDGYISNLYGTNGLPNSFFINEDGLLIYFYPGAMDYEQMNEFYEETRDFKANQNY